MQKILVVLCLLILGQASLPAASAENHASDPWRAAPAADDPLMQRVFLPVCFLNYCAQQDYFDGFENPNSGWPVVEDADWKTEYLSEQYRIEVINRDLLFLVKAPTCAHENYTVAVDVRWAPSHVVGSGYGLLFGVKENFREFYMLLIHSDFHMRSRALYYSGPAGFEEIIPETESSSVNSYWEVNHLEVTREGDRIRVSINGQGVYPFQSIDDRIRGVTSVGLFAFGNDSAMMGGDARFDNFRLTVLPDSPPGADARSQSSRLETGLPGLGFDLQPLPEPLLQPEQ